MPRDACAVQRGGQRLRREIELLPNRLDASLTIDYLLPKSRGVAVYQNA